MQITLPKLNQSGANEWADVEDNDKAIRDVVNGELEDDNIAAGANIALSKLADGLVLAKTDLRIVRGSIGSTGAKSIGEGFTCKKLATGQYEITLEAELSSNAIVTVTSSELNDVGRIVSATQKVIKVSFVNLSEEAQDTSFHFIAIG